MVNAGTDATAGGSVISLPSGGGAIGGLGEKFSPDLFTGTGNFSVPIALPAGRLGVQPQLALAYSTGNGNGPFGLGWGLSLPGVAARRRAGCPATATAPDGGPPDMFILSGRRGPRPGRRRAPRAGCATGRGPRGCSPASSTSATRRATSGRCGPGRDADPLRHAAPGRCRRRTGGTRRSSPTRRGRAGSSPGGSPRRPTRSATWSATRYARDGGDEPGHRWDQPMLGRDRLRRLRRPGRPVVPGQRSSSSTSQRPDPFSDHRAGFEVRTSLRCRAIRVATHAADGVDRAVREYRFGYEQAPFNGASLLTRVEVVGVDDQRRPAAARRLPPLTFGYTAFDPPRRRFRPVDRRGPADRRARRPDDGAGRPARPRACPTSSSSAPPPRYWRNRRRRPVRPAPVDAARRRRTRLGEPGVQLIDADGDGRADLLVAAGDPGRLLPDDVRRRLEPALVPAVPAGAERRPRRPAACKLVDLDGDGLTDVLRSGSAAGVLLQRRRPAPGLAAHRGADGPGRRHRPGRPARSGSPT